MTLTEELQQIELLKKDENIIVLLEGIKAVLSLDNLSEKLYERHKSKKNKTINEKLEKFRDELVEEYDEVYENFYLAVGQRVSKFCPTLNSEEINNLIYQYGTSSMTLDDLIGRIKEGVTDYREIPVGCVLIKDGNKKVYVKEEEFDSFFQLEGE